MKIQEIIVVEGRDDESAIKRAVDAEVIITNGFGIRAETFERIALARDRKGVIIFTDPDSAGEQIRRRISARITGCKHAYLSRDEAMKKDNIGIENAEPSSIIDALKKARCIMEADQSEFSAADLVEFGLSGSAQAARRRERLGQLLRVGYANAKQLLNRLNRFGISRTEFVEAVAIVDEEMGEFVSIHN